MRDVVQVSRMSWAAQLAQAVDRREEDVELELTGPNLRQGPSVCWNVVT
jgi:hypothetical protein